MGADFSIAGRLRGQVISLTDCEEMLVEAVAIYRRHTHKGQSPFATDGPWALIPRDELEEYTGGKAPARMPYIPPSKAELTTMRERLEWLALIPADDDRRLVARALNLLARGDARVPWKKLVEPKPRWRTPDGLRWRYGQAMSRLCQRVNVMLRTQAKA